MPATAFWYCHSVVHDAKGLCTEASLLLPTAIETWFELPFPAFYLDAERRIAVQCQLAMISELACADDGDGNLITLFDGEPARHDIAADAVDYAENRVTLRFLDHDLPLGGSALLTTEPDRSFVRRHVVLDVLPRTLAEVPDFVAGTVEGRDFEDLLRGDAYERPPVMHSDEVLQKGRESPVVAGLTLLISYFDRGRDAPAAVVLDRQVPGGDHRFAGTLYAFQEVDLRPGTILSRRVVYRQGAHTLFRDVARLVSVDPG